MEKAKPLRTSDKEMLDSSFKFVWRSLDPYPEDTMMSEQEGPSFGIFAPFRSLDTLEIEDFETEGDERTEAFWYIDSLSHPKYKLLEAIPCYINYTSEGFFADVPKLGIFGHGSSKESAIIDVCSLIVQYYESLKHNPDSLSDEFKSHLHYLQQIIQEQ